MKRINNKGFTLLELLAVIVILAIIIIIVSVNILSLLTTSKEHSFRIYAERLLTKSQEAVLDNNISDVSLPGKFTFSKFGFKDTGKYSGCIYVSSDNVVKLYLTDGYYSYKNVAFIDIEKDHAVNIKKDAATITEINNYCQDAT